MLNNSPGNGDLAINLFAESRPPSSSTSQQLGRPHLDIREVTICTSISALVRDERRRTAKQCEAEIVFDKDDFRGQFEPCITPHHCPFNYCAKTSINTARRQPVTTQREGTAVEEDDDDDNGISAKLW